MTLIAIVVLMHSAWIIDCELFRLAHRVPPADSANQSVIWVAKVRSMQTAICLQMSLLLSAAFLLFQDQERGRDAQLAAFPRHHGADANQAVR